MIARLRNNSALAQQVRTGIANIDHIDSLGTYQRHGSGCAHRTPIFYPVPICLINALICPIERFLQGGNIIVVFMLRTSGFLWRRLLF